MGLKFSDEDNNEKPENSGQEDSLLDRLRNLIKNTDNIDVNNKNDLEKTFGKENAEVIGRVQKRIDELVNAAHEFLIAREKGDPTQAMMNFMRLVQDTCIKYSPIEIGSILSTGMVALATLERSFGIKPEDLNPDNDNN